MEVKELSKYKDIKREKEIASHEVKAIGINWRLLVYMEQSNDDNDDDIDDKIENTEEVAIGVYLYADLNQNPRTQ